MARRKRRSQRDSPGLGTLIFVAIVIIGPPLIGSLIAFTSANWPVVVVALLAAAAIAVLIFVRRRAPRRRISAADASRLFEMDPYAFEHFCADLLRTSEHYEARVTPQSGDHGVDIVLRSPTGERGVAQCKQVVRSHKISRPVLQSLYGEMTSRGASFAWVLTTGGFTSDASDYAARSTRGAMTLVDFDDLLEMMAEATTPSTSRFRSRRG